MNYGRGESGAELARRGLHGLVLFHPVRIAYLTGFYHLGTERPVALVIPAEGDIGILVPKLEQEHVAGATGIGRIDVYPEYPTGGTKHPMLVLADLIGDRAEQNRAQARDRQCRLPRRQRLRRPSSDDVLDAGVALQTPARWSTTCAPSRARRSSASSGRAASGATSPTG